MCGIAGAMFWPGRPDDVSIEHVVTAMVDRLTHRGPDGRGVRLCTTRDTPGPQVAFGHTRLAILDLSERGAQPMIAADTPVSITFNGEIYNFKTLRSELQKSGRTFRSDTDTEVILQGYEAWGAGVFERLQGMFAAAIWDDRTQQLWIGRDRLGIKPVYVFEGDGVLLFASELRALLSTGLVPRRLDPIAVEQYLAYQTVPPPRTLIERVRLLPPAHILSAGRSVGSVSEREYWNALDSASPDAADATSAEARARVHALLEEATAMHLISDVPVGVFLSGGIDSSAMVAMTRAAGVTPRTFTVVLPGTSHDEAPYARQVAEYFGADHTEIALGEPELRQQLPEALDSVDHPSGDGFNTFAVSRAVRAAGVKVALSGLGGDEFFCGYPSFRRLAKLAPYARAWRRSPEPLRGLAASAVRAWGGHSVGAMKAAAMLDGDGSLPQTFPLMRQLFSASTRRQLMGKAWVEASASAGDPYVELLEAAMERHPGAGLMSLISYGEARTYMHDVLLRDSDQMSMAHGLEIRVPLLDHRLIEYVMGLPDRVKAPTGRPKQLLIDSLGVDLPAHAVNRPKQGFVLPFDQWMRGPLKSFCEHHLGASGLGASGLFDQAALTSLWQSFLSNDRKTSWSRPWTLVALSTWIERQDIGR